jgi:glycosyltransferase involved in cell wall biosynthesis
VVAVAEGGPCDTVQDGISGYLVPADTDALGNATARLLADTTKAEQMGRAGASFVASHYNWNRGAETLLGVLKKVEAALCAR